MLFVQFTLEIVIIGMIIGGSIVLGELIMKAILKAIKGFIKGFKVPTAGPKLQQMIDDQDFPAFEVWEDENGKIVTREIKKK